MARPLFVPLHLHTPYSLAEGAVRIKPLAKKCAQLGYPAAAMTDTSSLAGGMEFCKYLPESGVQPIVGLQLDWACGEGEQRPLVFLCQSAEGYSNLMALLSRANLRADFGTRGAAATEELRERSKGLIVLTGGPDGPLDTALAAGKDALAKERLKTLSGIFGDRLYVELQRIGRPREASIIDALVVLAAAEGVRLAAANEAYFEEEDQYEAHDALLCIAAGTHVVAADRRRVFPKCHLRPAEEMVELFSDLPDAVANTLAIAKRCGFAIQKKKPMLPAFPGLDGRTEEEELRVQSKEGLDERLAALGVEGEARAEYDARLVFELDVIAKMGFPGYFLIVSDFIKWAKKKGIAVGPGRGSGAGSLVAYSLQITNLDPLRYGLLFERFLNPERVSMPDFDVDFEQERREEVIDYVKGRYGAERVGQIGTYGKLQARAVVRDVGRVLQVPFPVVDRLCRMIPNNPAQPVTLAQAMEIDPLREELERSDSTIRRLFSTALRLEGLFRHSSTHAAGVVIADRPLEETVPLMRDERGNVVTQFDMKSVEDAGLVKFDFLGLKTLDVVQGALAMIKKGTGIAGENGNGTILDLDGVGVEDPGTYAMLAKGDAFGVFQLESAGMRQAMRQIVPTTIEDLIALVSLYRPGPMAEIPNYAAVKNGVRGPSYEHDGKAFTERAVSLLEPILGPTYGVIIYQEQVMEIGRKLAGYSLGGADLLRRAMGKKIKAEMDQQRGVFVQGCVKNDIDAPTAELIFDKVAKFADYGFNKSHAAAYAYIAFQTAYLRRHWPHEFYAASMNLDLHDVDKLAAFQQEIRRDGLTLLPPDVNQSDTKFKVVDVGGEKAVRYALAGVRGVGASAMDALIAERTKNGRFKSLHDLVKRTAGKEGTNKRTFEGLVKAGALDALSGNRAAMLAAVDSALRDAVSEVKRKEMGQGSFFDGLMAPAAGMGTLPDIPPATFQKRLADEYEALGLYLSGHPLAAAENRLRLAKAMDLRRLLDVTTTVRGDVRFGALLLDLTIKTSRKDQRPMGILLLSDPTAQTETMLFDEDLHRYREILEIGKAFLFTTGVKDRDGERRLYLREIEALPLDDGLDGR